MLHWNCRRQRKKFLSYDSYDQGRNNSGGLIASPPEGYMEKINMTSLKLFLVAKKFFFYALMLAPAITLFYMFHLLASVKLIWLSVHKFVFRGPYLYIGFDYYLSILRDPEFIHSLGITLMYSSVTVLCTVMVAMLLALAASFPPIKGKVFFKIVFFLPVITAPVTIGIIMKWFFHPIYGIINVALGALGIPGQKWLADPHLAFWVLIGVSVWQGLGIPFILFLANLTTIDRELNEAAEIDGANAWNRFVYIIIPQLRPAMYLSFLLCFIFTFRAFTLVYIMTQGGPSNTTNLLAFHLYSQAFKLGKYSLASAGSMVMVLIISLILGFRFIILRRPTEG